MWLHSLISLIFWASNVHAGESAVEVARLPRFRCEQALQRHTDRADYHSASVVLASIFDYSTADKAMDILPGVKARALRALGLDPDEDLRNLRLATRWLRAGVKPEAELYVRDSNLATRPRFILNLNLLTGSIMRWRGPGERTHSGAILPADVELGLLAAEMPDQVQPYLSVRLIEGAGAVFVLGLDVDCELVRDYTANPAATFRVLTEQGILCSVPVMLGEAVLHGREHLHQFN